MEVDQLSVMSPPTFINLPPPYSEEPSPMYNLCNTAAAATLSTSSYTSSSITTTGNGTGQQQQQYCELHLSRFQNLGQHSELKFQKKSIFKSKKSNFLTFSKVQKHIFCYFKNGKKSIFAPKKKFKTKGRIMCKSIGSISQFET